jgi:hypothetical protein
MTEVVKRLEAIQASKVLSTLFHGAPSGVSCCTIC